MLGEVLIVSALLAAGLLPLAIGFWKGAPRLARLALPAAGVAWLGLAASLGQAMRRADALESEAPGRPVERRLDGFASSKACQSCHPDQYASWHASYHRTMTQVASPESVRGSFDGEVLQSTYRYELTRRGDDFWVRTDDPQWPPDASGLSTHRVRLVSGSHHQQIYWFETGRGRTLARLPFMYRIADARWVPIESVYIAQAKTETRDPGRWNRVCIRCHATHGIPRLGEDFESDTLVAELGIACESCHGPGQEHALRQRDPLRRYAAHWKADGSDDLEITNPEELPAARSVDVCGRCHSVHALPDRQAVDSFVRRGLSFRPGEELDRALHVFRLGQGSDIPAVAFMDEHFPDFFQDTFWPDGQVTVVGRELNDVRDSPCFAGGEFGCVSCHEMHPDPGDRRPLREWADDQLAPEMRTDRACLPCHAGLAERLEEHTHHPAGSEGSRCMNCHMPHTAWGLLKASRTHRISSPDVSVALAAGRPEACTLCHLDRTSEWSAAHLEAWYGTPRPRIDDAEHRGVAAGVVWALRGHAAQRALAAWHMGWAPAQEASGSDWMLPVLGQLLLDPYSAVRYVAHRAIQSIPGYGDFEFDPLAPDEERQRRVLALAERWRAMPRQPLSAERAAALVLDPGGGVDPTAMGRLLAARDDRRIYRAE